MLWKEQTDQYILFYLLVQEKYDSTLLNSRLIVFGNMRLMQQNDETVSRCQTGETATESSSNLLSSSDVLCYASVDEPTNIDDHVVEFLSSLFWVLESKRLDRSCEHTDNLTLPTAPFEQRKDSSITDLDGRLLNFYILFKVHDIVAAMV